MLNPILTFFIFFVASLAIRVITMSYYPQYTDFAHLVSSILIAMGIAFSTTSITTRFPSIFPSIISQKKKEIIFTFIIIFLIFYYGYKP